MMRVIKGASVAKRIRNIVVEDMKKFVRHVPNPQLNVLLVGNEPSSHWYAGAKVKLGKMLGIKVNVMEYGDIVETEELIAVINNWNTDSAVNGIIIEHPLEILFLVSFNIFLIAEVPSDLSIDIIFDFFKY